MSNTASQTVIEKFMQEFAAICKNNYSKAAFELIRARNDVPAEVSKYFYDKYSKGGTVDMKMAFDYFYAECYGHKIYCITLGTGDEKLVMRWNAKNIEMLLAEMKQSTFDVDAITEIKVL